MKNNEREALVNLLNGIGLIVLLIGIFLKFYDFTYGLVAAIAIWTIAGVVKSYYGMKEKTSKKPQDANGLLVMGLIIFFIGIGILLGGYFALPAVGGMYIGGFITAGIGLALLISYSVIRGKKGKR